MFWLGLFGSFLFGSGSTTLSASSTASFEYNGYEFWNTIFRLANLPDFESAESILFETYDIALANGGGMNGYKMKPKRLRVEGVITADSASELEDAIDQLKYAVLQNQKTLTYTKQNGVVVQAVASCTNLSVLRKPYHITFCPVNIEFTILDPFLYWTTVNETTDYWNTADFSGTCSVLEGNYEAYPIAYITYNSATSCTTLSFTLNGQTITLTDTFIAGDLIIIDSKTKEVSKNSVAWQDYTGEFATLPLGDTAYSVDSDGTFNIDLVIQRYDTYV